MEHDVFADMRRPGPEETEAFGGAWCFPEGFCPPHGEPVLCAKYPFEVPDKGRVVEVYREALPAVSYTIRVGEYELHTGSGPGMSALAVVVAMAFAEGMLGIYPKKEGE